MYCKRVISKQKMLTENQQMLTKIQQMLIVVENEIFWLSDSIRMFSIVNHLLESRKRYLQLFLVRKIHVKMVQKMKNVKTSKKIFPSIQKMWWHEYVWMKTCPPEVFWTPYHTHKPITSKKSPLSRPREKMTFFDKIFIFIQNFRMPGQQE